MSLKDLQKIGLTSGEIKVYEALLELGECTKTLVVKESGVAPSNVYDIVNRLVEKGLVSRVEKNGVSHFSSANPRHLLDYLDEKKAEVEKEREIVSDLLPSLLLKYGNKEPGVKVELFQGWNGLKTCFEDLLVECNGESYVFGASAGESSEQADRFFLKYSKLRAAKGIRTKIVFNSALRKRKSRVEFFLKSKKYSVRFLDQDTPTEVLLYNDVTWIIILSKEPLVIRVRGEDVFRSFKSYFDVMWKEGKK